MALTNRQVAEAFARGEEGRSGNMFTDGETIYSYGYHFPIAKHYEGYILFTTEVYSNTTARHKSEVAKACNYNFSVPYVDLNPNYNNTCKHRRNIKDYYDRIVVALAKLTRTRKYEESLRVQIYDLIEEAFDYAQAFDLYSVDRKTCPEIDDIKGIANHIRRWPQISDIKELLKELS